MEMNDFMDILDKIEKFDIESRTVLIDIINKRFLENRREIFINDTVKSIEEVKSGNFSSGTSDDLFNELEI